MWWAAAWLRYQVSAECATVLTIGQGLGNTMTSFKRAQSTRSWAAAEPGLQRAGSYQERSAQPQLRPPSGGTDAFRAVEVGGCGLRSWGTPLTATLYCSIEEPSRSAAPIREPWPSITGLSLALMSKHSAWFTSA